MKGFRGTLLLTLLFFILGLTVYFFEIKGVSEKQKQEEESKKVFIFKRENIETLSVQFKGYPKIQFERFGENKWNIKEPLEDEADIIKLNNIVSALFDLEKQRTLEEDDFKPQVFKLDDPEVEVWFKIAQDNHINHLKIGRKAASGASLYIQVEGEEKAYLVSTYLQSQLNKTAEEYRNKVVVSFLREDLKTLNIKKEGEDIKLLKESDWKINEPLKTEASQDSVNEFLGNLELLRAERFVQKKELKVNKKLFEVSLNDETKLIFSMEGPRFFIERAGRNKLDEVMELDKNKRNELYKDLFYFREKKIFNFDPILVTDFKIMEKGKEIFHLNKKEHEWFLNDQKLKKDRVLNFLNALSDVEVEKFIDSIKNLKDYGLLDPEKEIILKDHEGKEFLKILIGKNSRSFPHKAAGNSGNPESAATLVYVKKQDKDSIYLVSKDFLNNLPKDIKEWLEVESPPRQ
ncbi:MAG: DUF4340 domain-containing protein [Deltaproteobacteria bacterium]|nr:DUF4340 domain-containing protein [Deltaproteobacteria bacterium]